MYDHLQLPHCVPGLVRLCSSSEEEGVQRTVAATLANLAYGSRENQLRLGQAGQSAANNVSSYSLAPSPCIGSIEALVSLLRVSHDLDVLENASAAVNCAMVYYTYVRTT